MSTQDRTEYLTLFSLPPIKESSATLPAVSTPPQQKKVTGDNEIDALLWLREMIETGESHYIEQALWAAKKIKTPLKEIEDRYTKIMVREQGFFGALRTMNFSDLKALAERTINDRKKKIEAIARFGDLDEKLFAFTPAELFCQQVTQDVAEDRFGFLNHEKVENRFRKYPDLMPISLTECMHELRFWNELYWLRATVGSGDFDPGSTAREWMAFAMLAKIKPASREEARAVHKFVIDSDRKDQPEYESIVSNLIG